MHKKIRIFLIVSVVSALLLSGCTSPETDTAPEKTDAPVTKTKTKTKTKTSPSPSEDSETDEAAEQNTDNEDSEVNDIVDSTEDDVTDNNNASSEQSENDAVDTAEGSETNTDVSESEGTMDRENTKKKDRPEPEPIPEPEPVIDNNPGETVEFAVPAVDSTFADAAAPSGEMPATNQVLRIKGIGDSDIIVTREELINLGLKEFKVSVQTKKKTLERIDIGIRLETLLLSQGYKGNATGLYMKSISGEPESRPVERITQADTYIAIGSDGEWNLPAEDGAFKFAGQSTSPKDDWVKALEYIQIVTE